jgi:glycosyltransferase involved in cell wall biosynthesis
MPAISVLMPCYNAAGTLEEALSSLERQTLTDFEVISIDDGSTDHTLEILSAWSQKDHRFRVLSNPHTGIITALNTGLAACQAPLIARMDGDDFSHPERLLRQVSFLERYPEISVVGCLVSAFPISEVREGLRHYMEWINSLTTNAQIRRDIFIESPFVHPSVVFKRDCVQQAGGYQDRGWPEDYDLWLRLCLAGVHFAKVPETLFKWRETPLRLTRTDPRYSLENFLRAKTYYLAKGPLIGRDVVIIWGAGWMGRRLGKHLQELNIPLAAYADIDPHKIGSTRRGLPVLSPDELQSSWRQYTNPVVLAAVGTRSSRPIVRARFEMMGLLEEKDWWCLA